MHKARTAKQLVEQKGILSSPNPKKGSMLSQDIIEGVKQFYLSEEVSRMMPGKKDKVTAKVNGQKVHLQKQLVLCNLKEAYTLYKEKFPETKIGFSKFAELRPAQCVLAGASGTHSVCVCTIHQNIKLMFIGSKMEEVSKGTDMPMYSAKDCLSYVLCSPPSVSCCLGKCDNCGDTDKLKNHLENLFEESSIDEITYKKWTNTDRSTLETVCKSTEDFIENFLIQLKEYQIHAFKTKMQGSYFQDTKDNLQEGEVLTVSDFAENYSFVVQDEAQSFHWNNSSVTLHPLVAYFKKNGNLEHLSFVVISESNNHDTVAVHLFQKRFVQFLLQHIQDINRIIYFSDGCAAQYKNCKNFLNLCLHSEDFGMKAVWNFFTTSHGKGPCDGLGGTVKRLVARMSLQRPYNEQILTSESFYQFCCVNFPKISFSYCTAEDYNEENKLLAERFAMANTIAGTQKLHYFEPLSTSTLLVKYYSSSQQSMIKKVCAVEQSVPEEEINSYVTTLYDNDWYLGCVLNKDVEKKVVNISFLHPCGPAKLFKFPKKPDVLKVPFTDILTIVSPTTKTGISYLLPEKVQKTATRRLDKKKI